MKKVKTVSQKPTISRELLSELLNDEVNEDLLNTHEITHLCKEWLWAMDEDFSIVYSTTGMGHKEILVTFYNTFALEYYKYYRENNFIFKTEQEAILKACEWVIKNRTKTLS